MNFKQKIFGLTVLGSLIGLYNLTSGDPLAIIILTSITVLAVLILQDHYTTV